jgi:hypothetical protein
MLALVPVVKWTDNDEGITIIVARKKLPESNVQPSVITHSLTVWRLEFTQ